MTVPDFDVSEVEIRGKRGHVESWRGRTKPEAIEKGLAAVDAFEDIVRGRGNPVDRLKDLEEAAASSLRIVWDLAGSMLCILASRWGLAQDAIRRLASLSTVGPRFTALACLGRELPRDLILGLLREGMQDTSSRVRSKAYDQALMFSASELIPDLEARAEVEADTKAVGGLRMALGILRDGYLLDEDEIGMSMTVKTSNGGLTMKVVEPDQVDSPEKLRRLVEELQEPLF